MTDLTKVLERLEKSEIVLRAWLNANVVLDTSDDPENISRYVKEYCGVCDSICAVRQEMRETEPRDAIDCMNYCPTCACRLPRPHELKDFRCPDSGGEPPCTCPPFMGSRPPTFCVHCDLEREDDTPEDK